MPNRTIYFRDDKLWAEAKKLAGKDGLSAVIHKAIEHFVRDANLAKKGNKPFFFTLLIEDELNNYVPVERIAFEGRVLWGTGGVDLIDAGPQSLGCDIEFYCTVAGKLVLAIDESSHQRDDGITYYKVYDSLAELREDPQLKRLEPHSLGPLLVKLSELLGEKWTIWID